MQSSSERSEFSAWYNCLFNYGCWPLSDLEGWSVEGTSGFPFYKPVLPFGLSLPALNPLVLCEVLIQAALGFVVLPKELLWLQHPMQSTGTGRTEGHNSILCPFSHAASCSAPGPCRGWSAQLALGALTHPWREKREAGNSSGAVPWGIQAGEKWQR